MASYFIFIVLIDLAYNYITYDSSLISDLDQYNGSGFYCENQFTRTITINFSGMFENVPQVILAPEWIDINTASTEIQLQITTITKQSFSIKVYCGFKRVITFKLRFYAIDDQRIEVINNFNMENPDDKTFPIKNPNAYKFLLCRSNQLPSIRNNIQYQIKQHKQHLHLQLLVQPKMQPQINWLSSCSRRLKSVTGAFSSGTIPIQPNRWFAIALQGLNYPNTKNMRLKLIYTNTATTISYTWGTWYESETPNSHSQVWIAYQFTNTYQPLECFTVRSSRKAIYNFNNIPTIYLELLSLNQIYTTIGNYDYLVDKSISPLNMKIEFKCLQGMKIKASFNKCNNCSFKKNHLFSYSCSTQINYVGFFPKFQQSFLQYNILKISISAQTLEVKQVIYDQKVTEQSILKVELMNQ